MMRHKPNYEVTYEGLLEDIAKNGKTLEIVTAKTATAGLRWYNKAYRKLDHYVLQPADRYQVPLRASIAAGLGFLGFQTMFRLPYKV